MPQSHDDNRKPVPSFYRSVLDEAELMSALEVEGIDQELAVLRLRLKTLLDKQPRDYELMLKGVQSIVRAAGTRYRISAKSKDDLAAALGALVDGVGIQLFPDEASDV